MADKWVINLRQRRVELMDYFLGAFKFNVNFASMPILKILFIRAREN